MNSETESGKPLDNSPVFSPDDGQINTGDKICHHRRKKRKITHT